MQHPCFISYAHPQGKWMIDATAKVIEAFKNAFYNYTHEPILFDEDRMSPSYNHEQVLSTGICQSACMVVLYLPTYLESDYCRRELEAMRDIEVRRQELLGDKLRGKRMFLPVRLRGDLKALPDYVHEKNTPLDYSKQLLTATDISEASEVRERLLKSAAAITQTFNILRAAKAELSSINCDKFELPKAGPAALVVPPSPFPGRKAA